jgi:exonuclease III
MRHPRYPIIFRQSYHPFPIRTTILQATVEYKPEKHLHLFGVHLLAFSLFAFELWRTWEISIVLREAMKYQTELCLVAGDFNTISPTDKVDRKTLPAKIKLMYALQGERLFHKVVSKVLKAGFTDCYRSLHTETGYTYPPPKPNTRLDYIFANAKMKQHLRECCVVTEPAVVHEASDHYPVLAKFKI